MSLWTAAPASGAAPRFTAPTHSDPPGTIIEDLSVRDLNRDGRSDVLVASASPEGPPGETSVLLADGGGRLSSPSPLLLTKRGGAAVEDMNGDGRRDVVRVSTDLGDGTYPYPSEAAVLFGDGRGAFPDRRASRIPCCPKAVAAGDLNGDHRGDLAVVIEQGGGYVLLGDGTGGFTRRPGPVGHGSPLEPVLTDLNRDRKLDLLVIHGAEEPHDVTVQLGDGRGSFSRPRSLPEPHGISSFAVGRFNADLWPDIAAMSSNLEATDNRVAIFLGARGARFTRVRRYDIGRHPRGFVIDWPVAAADFNGDRRQDLAIKAPDRARTDTGATSSETVRILLGRGGGRFARARTVARCCLYGDSLQVGFLNRDRRPDLVTVSGRGADIPGAYSEVISVLLNSTPR